MDVYPCDEITQAPIPDEYHLHRLLHSSYGIKQAGLRGVTGYEDCNYFLYDLVWEHGGPSEAILKVTNPLEAKSHDNIEFQVKLCDILNEKGIRSPKTIRRLDGKDWALEEVVDGVHLPVRVFGVLPGSNLENFTFNPSLVQEIGELLARFHVIADESKLSVAHIPYIAVEHRKSILNEMELQLRNSIISEERSKLIAECLAEFEQRIANNCQLHEVGLIHSDINETNVLITEENKIKKFGKCSAQRNERTKRKMTANLVDESLISNAQTLQCFITHRLFSITGLLDFGDVHRSFRIVDIASTVLYLHLSDKLQQGVESLARNVLDGYSRVRPLPLCTDLLTAMKARLSCSLIYGLRTARLNFRGGDVKYILRTQSNGWKVLEELHNTKLDLKV